MCGNYECKLCNERFEVCLGVKAQGETKYSKEYRQLFCRFCIDLIRDEIKKPINQGRKALLLEASRGNRIEWDNSPVSGIKCDCIPERDREVCQQEQKENDKYDYKVPIAYEHIICK